MLNLSLPYCKSQRVEYGGEMKRLVFAFILLLGLLIPSVPSAHAGDGALLIASDYLEGYDRTLFKHWIDADKDGCDTRAEVLIEEAIVKPKKSANCKLTGGKWVSNYDGVSYTNSSKLDVDHLVPLAEAWRSGAWAWTDEQRSEFANNLRDDWALNAVTASVNRSKSDKDISNWLPKKNKCAYLAGWVTIKARFELTVDIEEAKIIDKNYKTCGLGYQTKQAIPSTAPSASQSSSPNPIESPTPLPTVDVATLIVTPGAFCSPAGATGKSKSGVSYTCKTSPTDTRNRWRQ